MTALPKRKPARRTTMAKPEPRRVPSWAELTAPLEHYEYPVWPQAWWTASHAYSDQLAAGYATDQALLDEWHADAMEATFGPLDAWLHGQPLPDMMP